MGEGEPYKPSPGEVEKAETKNNSVYSEEYINQLCKKAYFVGDVFNFVKSLQYILTLPQFRETNEKLRGLISKGRFVDLGCGSYKVEDALGLAKNWQASVYIGVDFTTPRWSEDNKKSAAKRFNLDDIQLVDDDMLKFVHSQNDYQNRAYLLSGVDIALVAIDNKEDYRQAAAYIEVLCEEVFRTLTQPGIAILNSSISLFDKHFERIGFEIMEPSDKSISFWMKE